jgi:hypothetical protein
MKKTILVSVVALSFLCAPIGLATDVNCPAGGEPNLDQIVNEMMALAPEGIAFYDGITINSCEDLATYEVECTSNSWWRERSGYLGVTAKYAGHAHRLFWDAGDSLNDGLIMETEGGNQQVQAADYFVSADGHRYYFKLEDKTSGANWFSLDTLNSDSARHMVAYRLGNDVFVCGFEDLAFPGWDGDYQDLVFMINHAAPTCIPAINAIAGQAVAARGVFDPVDLWDAVLDGEYDKEDIAWSWRNIGGGNIAVTGITNGMAAIGYPQDWHGEEDIVFTATVNGHAFDSDPVTFQVAEAGAPVVKNMPDQAIRVGQTFEKIHLDQYIELPPNYSSSDVTWTTQNLSGQHMYVNINEDRVATVSYLPGTWTGTEKIRFTGAINPSGSTTVTFTVVSGVYGSTRSVGGKAVGVDKVDLIAWPAAKVLFGAIVLMAFVWAWKKSKRNPS